MNADSIMMLIFFFKIFTLFALHSLPHPYFDSQNKTPKMPIAHVDKLSLWIGNQLSTTGSAVADS